MTDQPTGEARDASRRLRPRTTIAIVTFAVVLALASAAGAAPGRARLAWSTYLRAGPSVTSAVVDELEHDTPVVLASCAQGWCRVSADGLEGFIDRDAIDLSPSPPARPQAGAACVVVGQADARQPRPTRFCSAAMVSTGVALKTQP